jgi:spermidine/putrescine transport system permease protein
MKQSQKNIFQWFYLIFILGLIYLPLFVLLIYSVNDSKYSLEWKGFTWKWYESLWEKDSLFNALMNSLKLGVSSALMGTFLGGLTAYVIYRFRFKGRMSLQGSYFLLGMMPDIVMGIGLLVLFTFLHIELGPLSLFLSHITLGLPFVVGTVYARLMGLNPHLIEAALDLGASEGPIFLRIILPLLKEALLVSFLMAFTLSMDDVVISFFVSGPHFEILPTKIYSLVRLGIKPEVNALASIMVLLSIITSFFLIKIMRRSKT